MLKAMMFKSKIIIPLAAQHAQGLIIQSGANGNSCLISHRNDILSIAALQYGCIVKPFRMAIISKPMLAIPSGSNFKLHTTETSYAAFLPYFTLTKSQWPARLTDILDP